MTIRKLISIVNGILREDFLCDGCKYGENPGQSCTACRREAADEIVEILEALDDDGK